MSNTTVKIVVRMRGDDVTYGNLVFTPDVRSSMHGIDVRSFNIRRGNDRFVLDELPIARVLTKHAVDDIVYSTFEADDDVRTPHFTIDFEIPSYDESHSINFRAVEYPDIPDMLFYEVEDQAGGWLPAYNVLLVELLPDEFLRQLETLAMESMTDHNIASLPMAAES